jgi:DNA-binding CsgD family transcriptional regulator
MLIVAEHENLVRLVETQLNAAREAPSRGALDQAATQQVLRSLEEQLRASLSLATPEDPSRLARRFELLDQVRERRGELGEPSTASRLDVLGRIQQNLRNLRDDQSPDELLQTSVAELIDACGFTRAMLSRVEGTQFRPLVYRSQREFDPVADTFPAWALSSVVPLEHGQVETEVLRRRIPGFIANTSEDRHLQRELMEQGRVATFVVSPVMVDNKPKGLIHADFINQNRLLGTQDRDNLWTFCQYLGFMFERLSLVTQLREQRVKFRSQLADVEQMLDEFWTSELGFDDITLHPLDAGNAGAARDARTATSRIEGLLTMRERQVLELLMTGSTNKRIAEALVISEGTVKSHVGHILEKLRVNTRSEAVAKFLHHSRQAATGTAGR